MLAALPVAALAQPLSVGRARSNCSVEHTARGVGLYAAIGIRKGRVISTPNVELAVHNWRETRECVFMLFGY